MDVVTNNLIEHGGVLGIAVIALVAALGILWKHLLSERTAHSARMREIQEGHAKEREAMREKFDARLESISTAAQQSNADTLTRVYELTRDVTKTTERVSAVVEENTKAIQQWGARVDAMGEKVLVLGERVEKLEGKK